MKKIFSVLSILIFPLAVNATIVETEKAPFQFGMFNRPVETCERQQCPRRMDMKQRLNLTEEQRVQAREIRMSSQAKIQPYVDELKQKQSQKMALVSQDGDENEIKRLGEDIKRLKHQIHSIRIQNEREFVQILTPEQKVEYNKMRAEGKKQIHNRRFDRQFIR